MKESSTSLRWFFGVIGGLNLIFTAIGAVALSALGLVGLIAGSIVMIVAIAVNVIESLIYIYFAFTLPKFLNPQKAKFVEWFVLATFALTLIMSALTVLVEHGSVNYLGIVISALVTWYLYHNVHKLSYAPAAPAAAVAPAPAPAPEAAPPADGTA
jgi:hypothetical protein